MLSASKWLHMVRIHTWRGFAFVVKFFSGWNGSVNSLPKENMGATTLHSVVLSPIAAASCSTLPNPATSVFVNDVFNRRRYEAMASDPSSGLSSHVAVSFVCFCRKIRFLTASAFTQAGARAGFLPNQCSFGGNSFLTVNAALLSSGEMAVLPPRGKLVSRAKLLASRTERGGCRLEASHFVDLLTGRMRCDRAGDVSASPGFFYSYFTVLRAHARGVL
jgi:hypothetical protein